MTTNDREHSTVICQLLHPYLDDELDSNQKTDFLNHLEDCEECRRFIDSMTAIRSLIISEKDETIDDYADLEIRRRLQNEALSLTIHDDDTIYDLPTVARILKISRDEVRQLVEEIPAFSIGGKLRVRKSTLLAWIEKQETSMSWNRPVTPRKPNAKILPFKGGKTA